jgi:hypothetical protein
MKRLFKPLLLVGLIALGYWAWTVLFPKPEQIVRNHLNKLAKLASFSPNDGNFKRVANVQKLGLLFDENVQVAMDVPGGESHSLSFSRREELMQAVMAARRFASGVSAEFLDMNIQMAADEQSATADLILKARVSGESDMIAQELKFTFKQTNGDWLITRVETIKSLKP